LYVSDTSAGQLHETLKQRILQLSDEDQIEILSNIEVTMFIFHALNFYCYRYDSMAVVLITLYAHPYFDQFFAGYITNIMTSVQNDLATGRITATQPVDISSQTVGMKHAGKNQCHPVKTVPYSGDVDFPV